MCAAFLSSATALAGECPYNEVKAGGKEEAKPLAVAQIAPVSASAEGTPADPAAHDGAATPVNPRVGAPTRKDYTEEVAIYIVPFAYGGGGLHVDLQVGNNVWNGYAFYRVEGSTAAREKLANKINYKPWSEVFSTLFMGPPKPPQGQATPVAGSEAAPAGEPASGQPAPSLLSRVKQRFIEAFGQNLVAKPFLKYTMRVTPEQRANLESWLKERQLFPTSKDSREMYATFKEQNKEKLNGQDCVQSACAGLAQAGINIPFPFNRTPTALMGYLKMMSLIPNGPVEKVERICGVRTGPLMIGGPMYEGVPVWGSAVAYGVSSWLSPFLVPPVVEGAMKLMGY